MSILLGRGLSANANKRILAQCPIWVCYTFSVIFVITLEVV